MKVVCITLLMCFLNCYNKEAPSQNLELKIKVVNNLKNEPITNATITVYKMEKSNFGEYFRKQHELFEKKSNKRGCININIDNKSTYKITVTLENEKIWSCSDEFEAESIDFKKVYEIRCLDRSEKRNLID